MAPAQMSAPRGRPTDSRPAVMAPMPTEGMTDAANSEPTSDHQFLALSAGWALAADGQQWIVQQFEGTRRVGPRAGQEKWASVAFVGSTKATLRRVIREKGIDLTDEAIAALDAMPDRFLDWKASRTSGNLRPIAKSDLRANPIAESV